MSIVDYQVSGSNTNRQVTFRIEPTNAADANAAMFGMFRGVRTQAPLVGRQTTVPTANEKLAQLRTNLVVLAVSRLAVVTGLRFVDDVHGTGGITANYGPALEVTFETDGHGTFQVDGWELNPTAAKQTVADITDGIGSGGSAFIKTKPGLQSVIDALKDVSYDGGVTGPFGALSTSGNIVLPDGDTTAGAPVLSTGANAGLSVVFVR
ncbi:MAG: hypothetical protein D6816_03800 [Bacteroidetes bacterium]|nr:MAG: hypothetical protein D6816_03800 [Bacteroidota bacterium]